MTMSEVPATPDLVELTRQAWEGVNRHDPDRVTSFYAPDVLLDLSDLGLGTFAGVAAVRVFLEDWWGTWRDHLVEVEEIVDLGDGVVFTPVREDGRPAGSEGHVEQRLGWVFLWEQGLIERASAYFDIDEARAAAERLAADSNRGTASLG
jgi:ketosteroid isomerase-like protein